MLATAPMYWRCKVHSCSSACSSENLHPLLAWTLSSLWTRWQPEAIHKNKRKSQSQMLLSQKSVASGLIESEKWWWRESWKLFQVWCEREFALSLESTLSFLTSPYSGWLASSWKAIVYLYICTKGRGREGGMRQGVRRSVAPHCAFTSSSQRWSLADSFTADLNSPRE